MDNIISGSKYQRENKNKKFISNRILITIFCVIDYSMIITTTFEKFYVKYKTFHGTPTQEYFKKCHKNILTYFQFHKRAYLL